MARSDCKETNGVPAKLVAVDLVAGVSVEFVTVKDSHEPYRLWIIRDGLNFCTEFRFDETGCQTGYETKFLAQGELVTSKKLHVVK